jgi:hypothetical protein
MVIDFSLLNMLMYMARCKTTVRKQVTKVRSRRHPEIDWMLEGPSESHDNGRTVGYFLRELRSLLHTHDYHARGMPGGDVEELLRGLWLVTAELMHQDSVVHVRPEC